ncbi:entericidin EcnA/B family protein [Puniceibacterium confluentis]|nr:entericidin EcnA/B family protein [Puniceibacterium confluentis]
MTRKIITLTLLGLLAGCATVDGIGQDISGGARRVQSWL